METGRWARLADAQGLVVVSLALVDQVQLVADHQVEVGLDLEVPALELEELLAELLAEMDEAVEAPEELVLLGPK